MVTKKSNFRYSHSNKSLIQKGEKIQKIRYMRLYHFDFDFDSFKQLFKNGLVYRFHSSS